MKWNVNPVTYKREGAVANPPPPPLRFFWFFFFLENKTSAPDVFGSWSFIPRAHFETSSVMVSYYGYEIDVISSRWSNHFWVKIDLLSTSFNNKSKSCGKIRQSAYSWVKHKQILFVAVLTWFLFLGKLQDEVQDGDHCWCRLKPSVTLPPIRLPHRV